MRTNLRLSKPKLKVLLDKRIPEVAFEYLHDKAVSHSKVRHEAYKNLDGMQYFTDSRFSADQANLLFKFRTRMFDVRNNFRNNYGCTSCPLCGVHEDTQEHLLSCIMITPHLDSTPQYIDIFSEDNDKLLEAAINLGKVVEVRKMLIEGHMP